MTSVIWDTCNDTWPKVSKNTGVLFTSHKNLELDCPRLFQSSLVTSGPWAVLMVVLCLSGPVDLQGERQTGKASPHKPLSLSLGGKSLPEAPLNSLGTHNSLARTVSCDYHSYKRSWENEHMQWRAMKRWQHGCRVDNQLCHTHILLQAEHAAPSKKIRMWKPNSPMWSNLEWVFCEVIRIRWGHKNGAPWWGYCPYKRSIPELTLCLSVMRRHGEEAAVYEPGRQPSPGTELVSTLILPSLQNCEK